MTYLQAVLVLQWPWCAPGDSCQLQNRTVAVQGSSQLCSRCLWALLVLSVWASVRPVTEAALLLLW